MKLRPTALTPLFLPREARETELIILEYHRINGHSGGANTLANLRMRYWFTKGRITIRNVLRKYCFACRRESMQPFAVPPWPQLPTSRVTNARPFYFTGLDFFGPVYLRAPNGSGGFYTSKYYVCIFVCMTLRAIHLELCEDLSTDAFLHAFKRFRSRREFPRRILSDNGLSFITAREVINRIRGRPAHQQPAKRTQPVRKVVSARLAARLRPAPAASSATHGTQQRRPADNAGRPQQHGPADNAGPSAVLAPCGNHTAPHDATLSRDEERFADFCQRHDIEWQTITELSPWKGGVYERLIGLVKHCLRRSIGKTKPTVVEFHSFLACAEHTANCRPLSYVADSDTDFLLIRPIDFLIPMLDQEPLQYPLDPPVDDYSRDDSDFIGPGENKLHAKIIKDLIKARRLADAFWQTFREGVLLELRNRGIDGTHRPRGEATIQPGDLVLVSETDVPRSEWRLALVLELLPHSDGLVRSARIRYATTKRETNRSLQHLYPIGQIPQATVACSTVSRLGICLSVLLSDIVSMSDDQPIFHYEDDDTVDTAARNNTVPISAASFDTSGNITLTDLRPPRDTSAISQPASVPADNAGQTAAALAVPGPVPADPTRRGLLIDPLELQIEHHRQVMVAVNEKMRIWDVLFKQYQRCLDLQAQGRPADRNLGHLNAELVRHFNTPMALPEAPRADPLADQSTQTEDRSATVQNTQTDISFEATHRRENDLTFWCKIAISGGHAQDNNPFVRQPQPVTSTAVPTSRTAPPPAAIGARAAAAQQSVKGSGPADNAASVPAVAQESGTADNAAPAPAPHVLANRPPFNSQALLRAKPTNTNWPNFPSLEEIERRVRQFFAPLPTGQDPPILEPIDEDTLYTRPPEQPQKFSFGVNRMSLLPIRTTWDPLVICNADGEQQCFHCSLRELRIIQATRWASGELKKDEMLKRDLQALLDRHVNSFGHMILLTYALRLYNKHTNVHALVAFLTQMLASQDFDEDIPKLLAYYQPRMIVAGTKKPWPTEDDFRVAAKRWACYCQRAYKDIFERLSGPIIWSPEWMRSKDLPSPARQAFDKMATNAATQLDVVRHMVYRHFSLKHILAVMHHLDYEWHRFDNIPDRELLAEGNLLALNETVCLVDMHTLHYFGAALREKIAMHVIPSKDSDSVIDYVLDIYPSREVKRLVLWFGTEYIVDNNHDDYGGLLDFLGHHFASNFGWIELIVVAPPYAQTHRETWTDNVLGLLVQKDVMLPHARLIIDPHDLTRLAPRLLPH
ncbi:hypothetical protein AAVH_22546 [Aphelenchoides avenae]|nr:hypothetical protein AAVH_22546 [Aphelenchus avenae]